MILNIYNKIKKKYKNLKKGGITVNKETQINWHSSDKEIESMTYEQAIELIQNQINLGKSKGDYKPRKHMVKAFELAVEALKRCEQ